jgi:hypothetical protein
VPLAQDKFFQFIKSNKLAREILVKDTEAFNVDTVVEKALKQNIGPDPSVAMPRKLNKLPEELPSYYDMK